MDDDEPMQEVKKAKKKSSSSRKCKMNADGSDREGKKNGGSSLSMRPMPQT